MSLKTILMSIFLLLASCSSSSYGEKDLLKSFGKLEVLRLGVSTSEDVKKLFGKPGHVKSLNFEDRTDYEYWNYDVIYTGKLKIPVPSFQVLINTQSRVVQGYRILPHKLESFGMSELKKLFPKAKLKKVRVDLRKAHRFSGNDRYRDEVSGYSLVYSQDRDKVFTFTSWLPDAEKVSSR